MAALTTEIAARYSADRLAKLTNPDSTGATSSDSTKLSQAATDAAARFEDLAGEALDIDNTRHVLCGIRLMVAFLIEYGAGTVGEAERTMKAAEEYVKSYARTSARNRITPTASTNRTPTADPAIRPDTDRYYFNEGRLNPPSSAADKNINDN